VTTAGLLGRCALTRPPLDHDGTGLPGMTKTALHRKPGQVVACCWLMTVFKHIIEVMTLTPVLVGREVCSLSSRLTTEAALEARAQTL